MSWKTQKTLRLGTPLPYELPFGPLFIPAKKRGDLPTFSRVPTIEPPAPQPVLSAQRKRIEKTMDRLSKSSRAQKRLKPATPAPSASRPRGPAPTPAPADAANQAVDLPSLRPRIQVAIAKFFGNAAEAKDVATSLEDCVWKLHEQGKTQYRKRCRAVYRILQESADTREKLLRGELAPEKFVESCERDFVSAEVKAAQEKAAAESLADVTCDAPTRMRSADYVCPQCDSHETEFQLLTSHRTSAKCDIWGSKDAAERDSVRVFCLKCTTEWSASY